MPPLPSNVVRLHVFTAVMVQMQLEQTEMARRRTIDPSRRRHPMRASSAAVPPMLANAEMASRLTRFPAMNVPLVESRSSTTATSPTQSTRQWVPEMEGSSMVS